MSKCLLQLVHKLEQYMYKLICFRIHRNKNRELWLLQQSSQFNLDTFGATSDTTINKIR